MTGSAIPFGPGALAVIGGYLCSLLVIGWLSYRARREDSLSDFYLAGRGFGFVVLLLTLYATQYSGNTLLGFTGNTYRIGYAWTMSLHFMTAVVVFFLLYAPQLYALARRRGFITPTDFLHDRYRSAALDVLATLVMTVALANYLLAQLMAMGRALEGLAASHPEKAYVYGVIVLALIIVIYETLGGLRAVAWTDALQGIILLSGFAILLVLVFTTFGSIGEATERILAGQDAVKAMPPGAQRCREWLSYVLLVGMGGALYPHAIQRIYAARSQQVLRRSLAVMAFLPLTSTLVALVVGIMASAHLPGLQGPDADQVLMLICRHIQSESLFGYWLVVVLFAAVLAAIMSTADSALLSISSMLTKDIYARFVRRDASEHRLTQLGKQFSWILVVVLVALAIGLRKHATLVNLMDRKLDLLVQLVPAFMVGIHWPGLRAGPTLGGLAVGLALALALALCGYGKIEGIHAGLFGLAANLLISVGGSLIIGRFARGEARRMGV